MRLNQSILILIFISPLFGDITTDFSKISPINKKDKGRGVDLSFPNGMLGFYLYTTNTEKLGYYFDFRAEFSNIIDKYGDYVNIDNNSIYTYGEDSKWSTGFDRRVWGDSRIREDTDYMMCNVGLIKNISNYIFLYGGGGISRRYIWYQYYDDSDHGDNDKYWIIYIDSDGSVYEKFNGKTLYNFIYGMIILPNEDVFFNQIKLGINSAPLELSIGLGWNLFRNSK